MLINNDSNGYLFIYESFERGLPRDIIKYKKLTLLVSLLGWMIR